MKRIILPCLALSACCAKPTPPAVEIRTVTKTVEIQRPCAVTVPKRPAPLGSLPTDLAKLAATLGAKLSEWSGPGGYGDQADRAIRTCTE